MNSSERFLDGISQLTAGLFYISETDAVVEPFVYGKSTGSLRHDVLSYSSSSEDEHIETASFDSFFEKVSATHDWQSSAQRERADRFSALGVFLRENLKDLLVFRIGRIRVQIFIAGVDGDGNVAGVKTFSVET